MSKPFSMLCLTVPSEGRSAFYCSSAHVTGSSWYAWEECLCIQPDADEMIDVACALLFRVGVDRCVMSTKHEGMHVVTLLCN